MTILVIALLVLGLILFVLDMFEIRNHGRVNKKLAKVEKAIFEIERDKNPTRYEVILICHHGVKIYSYTSTLVCLPEIIIHKSEKFKFEKSEPMTSSWNTANNEYTDKDRVTYISKKCDHTKR